MNTVENINKVKRIRGYGEGSVYQRKDGRWVGKYKDEKMLKPRMSMVRQKRKQDGNCVNLRKQ